MRIVGGVWKGRVLEAPEGREVTRPTTDRVREAMASMITSARGLSLEGAQVLDVFAGSGALGFEILSRGASRCCFVDRDRAALARVRRNAQTLAVVPEVYQCVRGDMTTLAQSDTFAGSMFDVILLDPPYATEASCVAQMVEQLVVHHCVAPDAVVVYERRSTAAALEPQGFDVLKQKRYGQTAVDLLRRR